MTPGLGDVTSWHVWPAPGLPHLLPSQLERPREALPCPESQPPGPLKVEPQQRWCQRRADLVQEASSSLEG